ncbi:hypothetical protein FRC17_004094 [Serendipita sp. 399]|nr:hypothetical protein FRC17_004094 [Serendipita sp. 399]
MQPHERLLKRVEFAKNADRKQISSFALLLVAAVVAYNWDDIRHGYIAAQRTSRVAVAATKAVYEYKSMYAKTYPSETERMDAISECHTRAATHVLKALLANGGVFIKLGQHLSASIILPIEWQVTMRPCLDACEPSSFEEVQQVFFDDNGMDIEDVFSQFDPVPLAVASIAQVHQAYLKSTSQKVAVKIQHPGLQEFAAIDLKSTEITLQIVKWLFPDFEFSWLGREMGENLPKEMNFVHEASNAARVAHNFESVPDTVLYIPRVLYATKRTMVMEYVEGKKCDENVHEYLRTHGIDRNEVSRELSKIFSEQVYIHGFFHADPHPGNLLIRPSNRSSGPNFDIVLLDHVDQPLHALRFWLSLLSPPTEKNRENRQKYAELVGNIGPERASITFINPCFHSLLQAALTGRPSGTWVGGKKHRNKKGRLAALQQAASMLEMGNLEDTEMDKLRAMVVANGDIMVAMFDILRHLDSKILMLFKLNELTRSLDKSLKTTHPPFRIFVIVAQYCNRAVWEDDKTRIAYEESTWRRRYFRRWLVYQFRRLGFGFAASWMDFQGRWVLLKAWFSSLLHLRRKYIVVFKDHVSEEEINKVKEDLGINGGKVTQEYGSVLKGFAAEIPSSYATLLEQNIRDDGPIKYIAR